MDERRIAYAIDSAESVSIWHITQPDTCMVEVGADFYTDVKNPYCHVPGVGALLPHPTMGCLLPHPLRGCLDATPCVGALLPHPCVGALLPHPCVGALLSHPYEGAYD